MQLIRKHAVTIAAALVGALVMLMAPAGAHGVNHARFAHRAGNVTCDGCVRPKNIAAEAVNTVKLRDGAVTTAKLRSGAVTTDKIADGTITGGDLAGNIQVETSRTVGSPGSFQLIAPDLTLAAGAGSSEGTDPKFLGAAMGNVLGTNDGTANYVGGVIGHYTVTGANPSTYPVGAILAGVGDDTTTADGAVVAYIDGDSAVTTAGAAFKVMSNNSTAASGFDFGLDLQDAAHDGYNPVDEAFYKKGLIRMPGDVVVLVKDGAPVGTDGAGDADTGSLLIDHDAGVLYINTGTIASPTWTVVGSQT